MKKHAAVFIYFLVATLLITYPLIFHFTDRLPGLGDELLMTWIMNWNLHAIFTDPFSIFQANIFYPYANTLAYSDVFFTSSVIGSLPLLILHQPAVIYNFTLLFSFITLGFFTYLLVSSLMKNEFAGILSGTLMAFSTYSITQAPVLQLIGIEWIPLSLLCFIRFLERKHFRWLVGTAIFFIIQIYNSFLPGYFLVFSYFCILAVYLLQKKVSLSLFFNRRVLLLVMFTLCLIIPLGVPYFSVAREFSYARDIRDAIHFGNRPEYSLYPGDSTRLHGVLKSTFYSHDIGPYPYTGYLGLSISIGFILVIIYRFFVKKKSPGPLFTSFSVIGIGAYLLSLGPALQWGGHVLKLPFIIPLPYALAYYVVPGFKGMRNSGRWEFLTVFALAVIIGIIFAEVMKKRKAGFQLAVVAVIAGITLIEFPIPMRLHAVPTKERFPEVYTKIADLPKDKAIIELPLYSWRMAPYSYNEFFREYYSTAHYRKMVNGYSGFSPIEWEEQADFLMLSFPNKAALDRLRALGVSYLVIHKAEYDRLEREKFHVQNMPVVTWKYIDTVLRDNPAVKLQYHRGEEYIYELL